VLVVNADSPYRSLDDLRAAARDNRYRATGNRSENAATSLVLAMHASGSILNLPQSTYDDLFERSGLGESEFMFAPPTVAMPYLRAGKLRVLATAGSNRSHLFPEVQTVAERVPGFHASFGWWLIVAPACLPVAVRQRLTAEVEKALTAPDIGEQLAAHELDVYFDSPDWYLQRMDPCSR
jgi:tripartite-type tricarboxylate transporter receptor subunit TctC